MSQNASVIANKMLKFTLISIILITFLFEFSLAIRCYKCKGDDECDFTKRTIYIDNCTWATKCWGARIGGHFIRSCADDRCDLQLGVGSYIESKCCYTDMCNNENFFFPSSSITLHEFGSLKFKTLLLTSLIGYFIKKFLFF